MSRERSDALRQAQGTGFRLLSLSKHRVLDFRLLSSPFRVLSSSKHRVLGFRLLSLSKHMRPM